MDLLYLLDLNKATDIGVSYLFKKKSSRDFVFPVQHIGELGKDITYRSTLMPETTHLWVSQSRAYIPNEWNPGGKKLLSLLFKKIKKKIFK